MTEEKKKKGLFPPKAVPIPYDIRENLPKHVTTSHKIQKEIEAAKLEIQNWVEGTEHTVEQITRWKKLGLPKPSFVTEQNWKYANDILTPLQGIVCHLAAMAMKNDDIVRTVGCSLVFVKDVTSSLRGEKEIQRIQDKVWGTDYKHMIQKIVPIAIQVAFQEMTSASTRSNTKVEAAFRFIDHGIGRPTQTMDVQSNLLKAVLERLDGEKRGIVDINDVQNTQVSELTEQPAALTVKEEFEKKIDPLEGWVEENL